MTGRWFRMLVSSFPADARHEQGAEILDALAEVRPTGWAALRESAALLWASSVAWSRQSSTADGLRRSAYFGAVLWFGFLVAIGPVLRAKLVTQYGSGAVGWPVLGGPVLVPAVFMLLSLLTVTRSRWAAAALATVGIGAAGSSAAAGAAVGPWSSFVEAAWYELRWIGFALAVVIFLASGIDSSRRSLSYAPVLAACALGGAVVALPWSAWTSPGNYAIMLRWEIQEPLMRFSSIGLWQWISVIAVFAFVVLLFIHPALSAFVLPVMLHLLLVNPLGAVLPILVVGAAMLWRPLSRRIDVSIQWRKPQPDH